MPSVTLRPSGAGDLTFTPALSEDIANNDVVTFDNSTLTPQLETLLIDLVAARAAISMSTKFINKANIGGGNVWANYLSWGQNKLALTLRKLERLASPRPSSLLARS